jgi:hypothetical protein
MGNSPSSSKQKRKSKKYESESESGDEEVEYEEVEESVLQEVESEMTPKNSRQPRLESPVPIQRSQRPQVPRVKESMYERWKKPIRSATMFARHYAMTLHKIEVTAGISQESYWLKNLEGPTEEQSFRLSNNPPWANTTSEVDFKNAAPNWMPPAQNIGNSQFSSFPRSDLMSSNRGPADYRHGFNSMASEIGPRGPSDIGIANSYGNRSQPNQPENNFQNGWVQNEQGSSSLKRPPMHPNDYQQAGSDQSRVNPSHRPSSGAEKRPDSYQGESNNAHGQRIVQTDKRVEDVQGAFRDQEGNYQENSFVKTTYRQSEANSEEIEPHRDQKCQPDFPCDDNTCIDCINNMRARLMQTGSRDQNHELRDSLKRREMKFEVDREAMLENYLEKLVANKPSKVQKLLVEHYYRPRSNERDQLSLTVNNRISDAIRNKIRSTSRDADSEAEGRNSFIVKNLEDQLRNSLRNPEPVLLTECGVKMIEDKHGRTVPLKLVKFVKDSSIYDKGSINYGIASDNYENKNIAYLSDKYQMKNYISKQKEGKETNVKKSYSNLKSSQLWPKNSKFDKPSIAEQLRKNEKSRISQEVQTMKHTMNYTAVKHHPRNLNYRSDTTKQASPRWGSSQGSTQIKPQSNKMIPNSSPLHTTQARTERDKPDTQPIVDPFTATPVSKSYIKDRKELIRQAIENSSTAN